MIRDLPIGRPSIRISKSYALPGTTLITQRKWVPLCLPNPYFPEADHDLLVGGGTILLPEELKRVEVETELVVVLNAGGQCIPAAKAMDYVGEYSFFLDITASDFRPRHGKKEGPWTIAKGFDTFAPISKGVPAGPGFDPRGGSIRLRVNAVVRQDSNTSQMAFRIPQLIEASSRIMTLEPGTSSRQAHLREYGR